MYQSKEKVQNLILCITDAVSVLVSYILSGIIWLYLVKGVSSTKHIREVLESELSTLILAYLFVILFFNMNVYFLQRGKFEELKYVFKMNMLFGGVFAVILFVKGNTLALPRGNYVLTVCINVLIMYISHILLRFYLVKVRSQRASRVFIITTFERVNSIVEQLTKKVEWQNKIEGIILVDDDLRGQTIGGIQVVATYSDMLEYVKREVVDEVFISVPYDGGKGLRSIILELEDMGAIVHLSLEQLESFKDFDKKLNMINDVPVVTFSNRSFDDTKLLIKRLMDIVGSILGLLITGIIMIFIAPILLVESPGPLVFKQTRVGKNGRYFNIYKFRSMYKDAEERKKDLMDKNEMNGLMFKLTDDPRITKVGRFIRKTSIDELPQFFNVLKGDMSLVGTRPPTVDEFKQYEGHHKRRLSMKPGITGLWQVSGRSNIEDFEEVVKLDLEYIDKWGLGLDVKILLKTVGVISFGKGAK